MNLNMSDKRNNHNIKNMKNAVEVSLIFSFHCTEVMIVR